MKGGGTKCQTLGWWQMNEVVLKPEKKIKKNNFFFRGQKIREVPGTRYENDNTT